MSMPNQEQWGKINGSEPIILESPTGELFEILHPHLGAVVPTPKEQLLGSLAGSRLLRLELGETNEEVVVPATLLWKLHGEPCEVRSETREGYDRIDPSEVQDYISKKINDGWKQRILQQP
jgi:hypothetical protein